MKKPTNPQNQEYFFAVYAEDKKGLLGQLLTHFNRSSYDVNGLNVSRTDVHDLVLVTIEASVPDIKLKPLLYKLENIVEVYKASAFLKNDVHITKTGFYRMAKTILNSALWPDLHKYGASIIEITDDSFIIQKSGSDQTLIELYTRLDGEHLISFCNSGHIVPESLLAFDDLFTQAADA